MSRDMTSRTRPYLTNQRSHTLETCGNLQKGWKCSYSKNQTRTFKNVAYSEIKLPERVASTLPPPMCGRGLTHRPTGGRGLTSHRRGLYIIFTWNKMKNENEMKWKEIKWNENEKLIFLHEIVHVIFRSWQKWDHKGQTSENNGTGRQGKFCFCKLVLN